MKFLEKWIWLPIDKYPDKQNTVYSGFNRKPDSVYTVAEFKKTYVWNKKISKVHMRFSGDTEFQLFCNDEILATGPVTVEGDFIGNDKPRSNFYATELEFLPNTNKIDFFARVKLLPVRICEYSKGHGGFMLTAQITFDDGTKTIVSTDKTWKVRYNGSYVAPCVYDGRKTSDDFVYAEETDNIWYTVTAPLRVREEKEVFPTNGNSIILKPHELKESVLEFDMIYAGFLHIEVCTKGRMDVEVFCREINENGTKETFVFEKDDNYRGLYLHSAGNFLVKAINSSDELSEIKLSFITTYYPINKVSLTTTSDKEINEVLDVCRHTLKYCRQLHHLDSPRHCEPLACTGDYYIESLMTAFSFGDMSLAEFDVLRTAEILRNNGGRMFHTTYSLIWVLMLYDVYMFTGKYELLNKCEVALVMLLNRFETYIGDNGIIETPPNYMFVDWIYIDGLSMHHPPKAMGQTCLNMFYFGALITASKIFDELSETAMSLQCLNKSEYLKKAINILLFDDKKGIYFEGLNTKTPEELLYQYMPQNTDKRYYLKHSNILAAYFGICDNAHKIIEKIMTNECPGEYQPYFAHFLLEAIYTNGLRDKYTLKVIEQWKKPVLECKKGLAECFIPSEPTYVFDHSHAWGGTPLYSLPKALSGFKMLKPGFSEIELSPSLMGLESATVEIPTPYGDVVCEMKKNNLPKITSPKEITIHLK